MIMLFFTLSGNALSQKRKTNRPARRQIYESEMKAAAVYRRFWEAVA